MDNKQAKRFINKWLKENGRKRSEFVEIFLKEVYDGKIIIIKAIPKPIEARFIIC